MLETLLRWDNQALYALNVGWHMDALDTFFQTVTQLHKQPWFLFGILPLLILGPLYKFRLHALKVFVALGLTIALTDAIAYRGIKSVVHRARPFNTPELSWVVKRGEAHGFSFPSNHAANCFAGAGILTWYFRRYRYGFYVFAWIVALSRPVLGVHFPGDVLAGALLGSAVAWSVCRFGLERGEPWTRLSRGDSGANKPHRLREACLNRDLVSD